MSKPKPDQRCYQCGETYAAVKAENLFCAIVSGYEYQDVECEWSRHRWKPPSLKKLAEWFPNASEDELKQIQQNPPI